MRDVFIIVIEHSDQLSDVLDALPFDDAEFRELASKRVRNSRPLVDEQLPGCIPPGHDSIQSGNALLILARSSFPLHFIF